MHLVTWGLSLRPGQGIDVQRCMILRDERERREPYYRGPKTLTYREKLLETHSLIDDDAGQSMSMRCVGIVQLENRAKQVSGFTVETSHCGSGPVSVRCLWYML